MPSSASRQKGANGSFDLSSIIRDILVRWWVLLIAGMVFVMASYVFITETYTPRYRTTATMVVTMSTSTYYSASSFSMTANLANVLSRVLNSEVLKNAVAEEIGVGDFDGDIVAEQIPETNLLAISVDASSPGLAFRMCKAVIENHSIVTEHVLGDVVMEVLLAPEVPTSPIDQMNRRNGVIQYTAIAMVVLVLGMGVLSYYSDKVKNERDVALKLDTELIVSIPHERKSRNRALRSRRRAKPACLISLATTSFRFIEMFKIARTKIDLRCGRETGHILLVTAAAEGEGVSTIATNLALVMAENNRRVLLVDANTKDPSIGRMLRKRPAQGKSLTDVVSAPIPVMELQPYDTKLRLRLLLCKPSAAGQTDVVTDAAFIDYMNDVKRHFDYIIIDAPPVSVSPDAQGIAEYADAAVLVVRQNSAKTVAINDATDALRAAGTEVLGCVFNDVRADMFSKAYGGYSSRYSYYSYARHGVNGDESADSQPN
ncbi:MAG: P-loop NTPase [Clostridia bacterium]|nr:P-loop NTPase [Clostridia bacterium]